MSEGIPMKPVSISLSSCDSTGRTLRWTVSAKRVDNSLQEIRSLIFADLQWSPVARRIIHEDAS